MQQGKLFGLIGYPLGHSFSLQYFTEKFQREGLAGCRFELFPLHSIKEFPTLLQSNPDLRGLAVTIPYKEQVMNYLSRIDEEAALVGAVNCIKVRADETIGFNTDILGFEQSLKPLLKQHHKNALVLGSGGASKAVQYVLGKLGIPFLVVSRKPGNDPRQLTYHDLTFDLVSNHTLIINATPLGMMPAVDTYPDLPYKALGPGHLLYDLVYKPPMTIFLQKGKDRGAGIVNGMEMLLIQAEANWEIWQST